MLDIYSFGGSGVKSFPFDSSLVCAVLEIYNVEDSEIKSIPSDSRLAFAALEICDAGDSVLIQEQQLKNEVEAQVGLQRSLIAAPGRKGGSDMCSMVFGHSLLKKKRIG